MITCLSSQPGIQFQLIKGSKVFSMVLTQVEYYKNETTTYSREGHTVLCLEPCQVLSTILENHINDGNTHWFIWSPFCTCITSGHYGSSHGYKHNDVMFFSGVVSGISILCVFCCPSFLFLPAIAVHVSV